MFRHEGEHRLLMLQHPHHTLEDCPMGVSKSAIGTKHYRGHVRRRWHAGFAAVARWPTPSEALRGQGPTRQTFRAAKGLDIGYCGGRDESGGAESKGTEVVHHVDLQRSHILEPFKRFTVPRCTMYQKYPPGG